MQIMTFTTIAEIFLEAAHAQVWCSVATVDHQNRVRSRVLHPIWELEGERAVGWIATGRTSPKAKHIAHNAHMSLCYMKNPLKPLYVECTAAWADDPADKQRIWDLFSNTPEPLGYQLAGFFESVDNPAYGLLRLTPWRIELADLFGEAQVWSEA